MSVISHAHTTDKRSFTIKRHTTADHLQKMRKAIRARLIKLHLSTMKLKDLTQGLTDIFHFFPMSAGHFTHQVYPRTTVNVYSNDELHF